MSVTFTIIQKPGNLLLDTKDYLTSNVRISDFGLSELRQRSAHQINDIGQSTVRHTNNFQGTPRYCAPEMLVIDDDGNVSTFLIIVLYSCWFTFPLI